MTWTRRAAAFLSIACIVVPAACRGAQQERTQRSVARPLELKLERVLVDRVRLTVPARIRDGSGATRQVTEAHLVRLQIDHPPAMSERIRFFAGEYEIPEYGGWSRGIYFKVYDDALLQRLDGQDLAYSFLDEGRRSLGARLELPPRGALELRPEREVIRSSD